jgi:hypothetical protein
MSARAGRSSSRLSAAAGPLVAAILARKSTEQVGVTDEQRSVTRQVEHARAYALAHGWVIRDEYIFVERWDQRRRAPEATGTDATPERAQAPPALSGAAHE